MTRTIFPATTPPTMADFCHVRADGEGRFEQRNVDKAFRMKKNEVLAHIQDLEDGLIARFCSVKRRLHRQMEWVVDTTPYARLEPLIRDEIVFYEARGFYLFQEPWLEHEPFNQRFRVILTFRPTESNR